MYSISFNHAFKIGAAAFIAATATSRLAGKACEYLNTRSARKTHQDAPAQKATPRQNKMIKIASALIALAAGAFTANHIGAVSLRNLFSKAAPVSAGVVTTVTNNYFAIPSDLDE